ncbi:MAG: Mur ligase domain-containing protein, partial [Anaerolineae bacterium]
MKLSQLLAALPDRPARPDVDPDITLITTDSRQVIPGALFVAYPGVSVDGHRFIPQALERGAAAIIGERDGSEVVPPGAFPVPHYFKVRNGREAFAWL